MSSKHISNHSIQSDKGLLQLKILIVFTEFQLRIHIFRGKKLNFLYVCHSFGHPNTVVVVTCPYEKNPD